MSVDLDAIELKIAEVLATIPTFNGHVDAYERRDRTSSEMPLASVFQPEVETPGIGQPLGQFSDFAYSITWNIRCWIPIDDDVASQKQANSLTMELFETFNSLTNPLAMSGLVSQWNMQRVEKTPILDIQRPVFLVEGTFITWADG